jgi:DNA invertase Pin-like site-specific DNA recombinase
MASSLQTVFTQQPRRRPLTAEEHETVKQLNASLRPVAIAAQLHCSEHCVRKILRQANLRPLPPDSPRERKTSESEEETGDLIIIKVTKRMFEMSKDRGLTPKNYVLGPYDADLAELRRRQLPPTANPNSKGVARKKDASKKSRILEMLDEGLTVAQIAERNAVGGSTVRRFRDERDEA